MHAVLNRFGTGTDDNDPRGDPGSGEKKKKIGVRGPSGHAYPGLGHYLFGVLSLPLTLFSFAAGPGLLGARFRSVYPPMLAFMLSFSDMTIGVCFIALVAFRSLTEFFLGWRWRRKALRTERQTLTLVVSGGKILYAL